MPLIIEEDLTENLRPKLRNDELDAINCSTAFRGNRCGDATNLRKKSVWCWNAKSPMESLLKVIKTDHFLPTSFIIGKGHCFMKQVLEVALWLQRVRW